MKNDCTIDMELSEAQSSEKYAIYCHADGYELAVPRDGITPGSIRVTIWSRASVEDQLREENRRLKAELQALKGGK